MADIQHIRTLVIEDDRVLATALAASLAGAGFTVDRAENGIEGMKKIRDNPPDVVLLDLIMPVMDGFEVLAACAQEPHGAKFPIIVLTNLSSDQDKEKAEAMGAKAFLVKSNVSLGNIVEMARQAVAEQAKK